MPPQAQVDLERDANNLAEPLLGQHPAAEQAQAPRAQTQPPQQVSTRSSRNVRYTLIYTALAFAGRSVWSGNVLATYVYLLRNNNPEAVGLITAVMGISQLLASFPSGYAADSHRRDSLLKIASLVGVLAIGSTLIALWYEDFHYLLVALAVWGVCFGIGNTALAALFADSIRTGERSYYFTLRSMILTLGNTAGPLVAMILFLFLGNEWSTRDCVIVMMVGQAICFPAVLLLCLFSDDFAVDSSSSSSPPADEPGTYVEQTSLVDECPACPDTKRQLICPEQEEMPSSTTTMRLEAQESDVDTAIDGANSNSDHEILYGLLPKHRAIPILIASADILAGLGSGMSIRFFPIFFINNLKLSPVMVQVLYVVSPLLQATLMKRGQILAKSFGRCHVTVAFKWIGVGFMMLMIFAYIANLPTWFVCLLYIFRTAFSNAPSGLTRSLLMDNVPQEERGKWSALESVNMFSWSGSAALGGVLVGAVGLLPLFVATGCVQLTATLALIALFGHDTIEETLSEAESTGSGEDDEDEDDESSSIASNPAGRNSLDR
jgi:MFS family permease